VYWRRVIRQRFNDEAISTLGKLAWWNWPVEKITQNLPAILSANVEALPDK